MVIDMGNLEMVNLLVEFGADLNESDINHKAPIHAALKLGHTEIANFLIAQDACQRKRSYYGCNSLELTLVDKKNSLMKMLLFHVN